MFKKTSILTILIIPLVFSTFFFAISSYYTKPVLAQATCPSNMNPDSIECLDYLREQLSKIQNQQGTIQKQLKDEEYQQLSLQDKITYITNQVDQTEKVIKSLEVEIAAKDVEIKLLEKDIQEKEDAVSILRQEIELLEGTVNKRITESYKYSMIGPFEIFLDVKNLSSVLRKTKYLIMTRAQDIEALEDYSLKVTDLKREESKLSLQRADLQTKRNSIEDEKKDLATERESLAKQKVEKDRLLAQSKAKAAELQVAYQANLKKLSDLDSAIIAYINEHGDQARNYGHVNKGEWIGRMGSTGQSSGAHLHFSIRQSWSGNPCSGNLPLLSGYLRQGEASWITGWDGWKWPYMYSGSLSLPISGPSVIMSQNYHSGNALDLISYKTDRSVNYGAPIYSVMEGTLYKDTDNKGGVYAYIRHSNGWTSCYLHIQQ